ncbi:hypothetical protein MMC12_005900 [Toensbergia leucococca]|nr:hypothetical protein [Toensbergia leucococca]
MLYYMMWSVAMASGPDRLAFCTYSSCGLVAEIFGHWFNDFLAARYVRNHGGTLKPKARLRMSYNTALFMIPGLILLGQALQQHLNYGVIIIGWGMYVFGVITASVPITAYALESYPTASAEVSGLLNLSRVLGGFTVGYFQQS